jgi:PqqD family protein of HPr-rel-A system
VDAEQAERWRSIPGCELLWLGWDDGEVVYHGGSGDTHFLAAPAVRVLRQLQRSPAGLAELAALLADDGGQGGAVSDELLLDTGALLIELERLCLVERCR